MRAITAQAAWEMVGVQGLQVAEAWERMVSSDPDIKVPLYFADAMRELSDAARDHQEWQQATSKG